MAEFKPSVPFNVQMQLLIPTPQMQMGVEVKSFDWGETFFGSFRTFGGTEREVNGVYSVEDTATINTWYNPYIKSDCRIYIEDIGTFEIISPVEDINRRHQFMQFKVRRIEGGA